MSLNLIIMGVQGAGKGVQAAIISDLYDIPHISTGDLFRAMKNREDELALKIQDIMKSGQLVSDDDTNEVLKDRLQQPDAQSGVILDGYPRNIAQAEWLNRYLEAKGEQLTVVLYLKLDLYVAFKRAFGRVTSKSGKSYNIYYNDEGIEWEFIEHDSKEFPPKLHAVVKETGEELVRRPDDANAHAIIRRIDTFLESTSPLIQYYRDLGLLVEINADQPIDTVTEDIKKAIENAQKA